MSGTEKSSTTRRNLLQAAATGGAATALLGGLGINPALAAAARSEKPLKAASPARLVRVARDPVRGSRVDSVPTAPVGGV